MLRAQVVVFLEHFSKISDEQSIEDDVLIGRSDRPLKEWFMCNVQSHFLVLPVPLLQKIFLIVAHRLIIKEASFGPGIFQRMHEDLVFETVIGITPLDYQLIPLGRF